MKDGGNLKMFCSELKEFTSIQKNGNIITIASTVRKVYTTTFLSKFSPLQYTFFTQYFFKMKFKRVNNPTIVKRT